MIRQIHKIIIHCSATKATHDINAETIRGWHKKQGWADIGYHFVIKRNGVLEKGRNLEAAGAHTQGQNSNSIGICLVGGVDAKNKPEVNFSPEQWIELIRLLKELKKQFPKVTIHGHNEFTKLKACPSFDVQKWLATGVLK